MAASTEMDRFTVECRRFGAGVVHACTTRQRGAITISICRPSIFGSCSTLA